MQRQFFSGNSIEQAVMSAARHYQVDPERLAYKIRDKKHGFLNIRRRVVIEVDPDHVETDLASPPVATAEAPKAPPVAFLEPPAEARSRHPGQDRFSAAKGPEEDEPADDEEIDDEEIDDEEESDLDDDDPDFDDDDEADVDDDDDEDEDSDDDSDETSQSQRGGRGGRGRGQRGGRGGSRRGRRRDVKIAEFTWDDDEDGWDSEDIDEDESQELAAVEACLERILDVMDLEIEYAITEGETIEIDFEGEDSDFLIEDDGKVLKAIEHIVPRMVRGLIGRSLSVHADCEGFRAEHETSLKVMAEEAAEEVIRRGRAKTLNPMNPADRRIVHLSLVDHPKVDTVSQGHGFMKRVKIVLSGD